ncbi:MAG: hypothetical protein AAF726_17320 [Planctomycetota bacterium]
MSARVVVGAAFVVGVFGVVALVALTGRSGDASARARSARPDVVERAAETDEMTVPPDATSSRTEGAVERVQMPAPRTGTARIVGRYERPGPSRSIRRDRTVVQLWFGVDDPQPVAVDLVWEGAFEFEDLVAGTYTLTTNDDEVDAVEPFELEAGETREVVLESKSLRPVAVSIGFVDADGAWIDVAPWSLEIEFPSRAPRQTRANARFGVTVIAGSRDHSENLGRSPTLKWIDPAPGRAKVTGVLERLDALHFVPAHRATVEVELRPGTTEEAPLEVRLPLPSAEVYARISGRLPRPKDRMNRRAAVRGTSPDGGRVVRAFSTDAEGRFELRVRPEALAGPQLWISDPAGRRRSRAYALGPGDNDLGDIVFE